MTGRGADTSGTSARVTALIRRFDTAADDALEQIRGRRGLDAAFRVASEAGDFSAMWHMTNLFRGAAVRRPDQVVALGVALGAESLLVNQGVKRLFRRTRPTQTGDPRTPVRRPQTSSFPSGHASAAAFNATILTSWDRRRWPLWWGIASVVGISRVYVRIHHASDVVAGAALGAVLGLGALQVMRRLGIRR